MTSRTDSLKSKLLLVDDTPANLRVLTGAIRDEFDVRVATNGPDALELARGDDPPDMILLDIIMPGMDGYEVLKRLKADKATAEIPVIFVTAMNEAEDEAKGLDMGAEDYIAKPFNVSIVKARVRTQLNLLQARRDLAAQNRQLVEAARLKEDVERITRHDLKNPLTSVMSVPQLMMMGGNLTEHQTEMMKRVEESAWAMLRMINFSLDLFKMEQGIYRLAPEPVNLMDILRRVGGELENLAETMGTELKVSVDGKPPAPDQTFMVKGEELLCYSMLGNLVRNAMEAAPEGTPVRAALSTGPMARVEIHNMGAVPREIRENFFDKYATSGKAQGTGLGTYSARLTAEVLGGSIGFTTSDKDGTTVRVELPPA